MSYRALRKLTGDRSVELRSLRRLAIRFSVGSITDIKEWREEKRGCRVESSIGGACYE
jgi:hypothetical protein